jgi:chemotaxis protein MotB
MARTRRFRQPQPENHERWLVSYADFITLLFAFFVVLFANSRVDRERVERVSESVRGALENGLVHRRESKTGKPATVETALDRQPDLLPSLRSLEKEFASEIDDGKVQVKLTPRGLVVSMREAAFFPPGDDRLNTAALPMLEKLARTVVSLPNPVRMEGHTDSTPIATPRFKSNWELSAARAIALMDVMTSRYGVPRERVAIAGYADTVPVDTNDSPEGRARNRRVDVILLNPQGERSEPR